MNTELQSIIVDAECRFLTEPEMAKVREYAHGLPGRMAAMRRLEASEDAIVEKAAAQLVAAYPAYGTKVPHAKEKMARDMRLTLRYAAQAHVRADMDFFQKNYAGWIGELLKSICPRDVLVKGQQLLIEAMDANLDAADARVFRRYIEAFITELEA